MDLMKHFFLLIASIIMASSYNVNAQERIIEDFNFDWSFKLGDDQQFATKDFDDSSWRELHLPHDWSIEGEFSKDNPSTPGGGALPGGIGWYRKHFRSPKLDGRHIAIEFDGIFMNSTVFVNGHKVGFRPYGYSSMSYNITPYLNPQGEENIIAVRCDNSEQPNSRWYAGCGIYRNVRLVNTANVFVDYTGTYITTPEISKERGTIKAQVSISNLRNDASKVTLENKILDAKGRCVAKNSVTKAINAGASADMEMTIEVNNPILWDVDNPYLYSVVSNVVIDGKVVDDYITPFGFRYFEFKADTGFWLNGRNLKLKGVCMHHDLGALGTAVHRRGLERQLDILQSFGVNAIRTSHNPPTPELLDMCDERGILVMDEAFDMWRRAKTRYDYARYFDEWHQKDLIDFIKRDRNHPSIVMWSVGNEILEQWNSNDDVKLDDLPAEQRNLLINFISENATGNKDDVEKNTNVLLTRHMVATLKKYDNTRPVTAGCNETRPTNNLIRSGALDIIGFNYHVQDYDSVKEWYPNMPFIGSETASSLNSRGFYIHPSTKINVVPERWDAPHQTDHHQCSAYDNSRAPWATLHEEAWVAVRDRDFCAGTFIWTGFDYLGEPTPYSWPSRSSYFGIVDLCGFPKDCYYMYRSEWTNNPTLHLFPHWNWNVGDKIDMWVYYNTADEVELFLNGKSLGKRTKTSDRLHAIWENVEFEAGEITAIGYKNGKEILRHSRKTAGKAEKIVLTADRKVLKADGYDLAYVTVECTDAKGNLVPTAMNQLYFEVDGVGELVGVDNGNAAGGESLKGNKMKLFNGKAIAIVRTKRNESGKITLKVTSDDMESATVKLSSR
jgi:beta-galactosidase